MVTTEQETINNTQFSLFNENNNDNYYDVVANEVNTTDTHIIKINNAKPYYDYTAHPVNLINLDRVEEGIQHQTLPRNILQDHTIRLPEYYNNTDYIQINREQIIATTGYREGIVINNNDCCNNSNSCCKCDRKRVKYVINLIVLIVAIIGLGIILLVLAILNW